MRNGIRIGQISGVSIYLGWSWIFIFLLVTFSLTGVLIVLHPDWSPWLSWAVGIAGSLLLFWNAIFARAAPYLHWIIVNHLD